MRDAATHNGKTLIKPQDHIFIDDDIAIWSYWCLCVYVYVYVYVYVCLRVHD